MQDDRPLNPDPISPDAQSTDPAAASATGPAPEAPPPPPGYQTKSVAPPPPPPTRPRKGFPWGWLFGCGCLGLIGIFVLVGLLGNLMPSMQAGIPRGEKIAVIYVEGAITSSGGGGLFADSVATSERVISDLEQASNESNVRAILLRINSPGGSAAASQEIYQKIREIRDGGMPVVVSMGDMAASGGYYIAAAADEIVALDATITGSIGVIVQASNMQELFNKIGIKPETIKSGKHKDMFSPNRALTEEERQMAQDMVMDIYNQFVGDVLEGRKDKGLDREALLKVADGRIFTGKQAVAAKLVDRTGTMQDAITLAGELGGIEGEPAVWKVKRSFWQSLAEASSGMKPEITINISNGAGTQNSNPVPLF